MRPLVTALACTALLLAACERDETTTTPEVRKTPVTVAAAQSRRVEVLERSVGRLEAPGTPAVAAETAGRVIIIHADAGQTVGEGELLAQLDDEVQRNALRLAQAGVERIEPLLANQERTVSRARDLLRRDLAPQNALDEAEAQYATLEAQLAEARARLDVAERNLEQTRIRSPVSGVVQNRLISVGDYVNIGEPLFDIVVGERLRAVAPYPETVTDRLAVGQKAYVSPVRAPAETIETTIAELRPQIGRGSRSVDVILEFDNPGQWRPGASVTVEAVVATREHSVTVPSVSVVRRPAGTVVYVIEDGVARQRTVETGVQADTWVEILQGVVAGEQVARSGAGFLTDAAPVEVTAAPEP